MTNASDALVFPAELLELAEEVGEALAAAHLTMAAAESCTGGLLCALMTERPGSSDYFRGGVVAYSNPSKVSILGLAETTLKAHGAVSEETARQMAIGIRRLLGVDLAVSTTGIAGPGGGNNAKPVGLVYTGLATPGGASAVMHQLPGSRLEVRLAAVAAALAQLASALRDGVGLVAEGDALDEPGPTPAAPRRLYASHVKAVFDATGEVSPSAFRYGRREYKVAQIGGTRVDGAERVFTVMSSEGRMFELTFVADTLSWRVVPVGPTAI